MKEDFKQLLTYLSLEIMRQMRQKSLFSLRVSDAIKHGVQADTLASPFRAEKQQNKKEH